MNQVITFSVGLTADSANRTISGKIVPLNVEAGSTNMGKVIFASGSIAIEEFEPTKVEYKYIDRDQSLTLLDKGVISK